MSRHKGTPDETLIGSALREIDGAGLSRGGAVRPASILFYDA
jgi:hypothetical protein